MNRLCLTFGWLATALLLNGCAFRHAGASPDAIRIYPEPGAKPVALIHTETWCPALFYYAKLGNASLEKSQAELVRAARDLGADCVVHPMNSAEVHMPFPLPFILGWHEYHVWGTAVKP